MSTIVVNDVERYKQYIATNGQTIFDYPFVITDETELKVFLTPNGSSADDDNQTLILNSDYTVTGVLVDSGGTIVLSGGATAGDRITIIGNKVIERITNLQNSNDLNSDTLNDEFNSIIIMMQEIRKDLAKILPKYFYSELQDTKNLHLPALATDQYWKKTVSGIIGIELDESEGWSTLRSELANDQTGTDGSRIVGYYDSSFGSTTVHDAIGQNKVGRYGVDSGSVNAYAVTLSPAPVSLTSGEIVDVKISNTNTTTSTLDVNALGVKTIKIFIGNIITDVPANAMPAGIISRFIYDGTFFQLTNPQEITDFSTGYVALTYNIVAPSGWVTLDDGTIGSAASGATTRANADTFDLYEMLWDNVSQPSANAFCTVSSGLGASALADFSANKQLTLPYHKGRAIAGFGAPAGIPGYTPILGENDGEQLHLLTVGELASHTHAITPNAALLSAGGGYTHTGGGYSDAGVTIGSTGNNEAHNTVQPTIHVNTIIKL